MASYRPWNPQNHSLPFAWKCLWKRPSNKYPVIDPMSRIPQIYKDRGIEVIDPARKKDVEEWGPPVDDPRYFVPQKADRRSDYHIEPAFIATPDIKIYEGVKQAAILTKAQVVQGLPWPIQQRMDTLLPNLVDSLSLRVQREIMLANKWNTSLDRMPPRYDRRKPIWFFVAQYGIEPRKQANILIRNLMRLVHIHHPHYPDLTNKFRWDQPVVNLHVVHNGQPVIMRGMHEWLVTGPSPLPPFAGPVDVERSAGHTLPDLFPLLPTIDLKVCHNYTLQHNYGVNSTASHPYPHTIILTDVDHNLYDHRVPKVTADQRLARDIIFCFGYAVAQAKHHFGDVKVLPSPVCVQSVSLDQQTFNFACFQLNTLDFDTEDGVKNIVWVDGGNHLFRKTLGQRWMPQALKADWFTDLDLTVFHKFMSLYLHGC